MKQHWIHENNQMTLLTLLCDSIHLLFYIAIFVICVRSVIVNDIAPAVFGASIYGFFNIHDTAKDIFSSVGSIAEYTTYADAFFSFTHSSEKNKEQRFDELPSVRKEIRFQEVSFHYPGSESPAVNNMNLTLHQGETVAMVGVNGSGKTTFSKLLSGIYLPTGGTVVWDETNLATVDPHDLCKKIAHIPQKPTHFQLNWKEAVTLTDHCNESKLKQIFHSLDEDALLEKISASPILGKSFGHTDLSEGEWQKLAIARVLYRKDYDLLILDEPTGAISPLSEIDILKEYIELAKNKTALIITHRLGICSFVDRILVVDQGEIVQDGTHEELLNEDGIYRDLYITQKVWYQL